MFGLLFAAATSVQTFDLVCSGLTTTTDYFSGEVTERYVDQYRIDLAHGMWCSGECKAPQPIVNVSAVGLVLEKQKVDTGREYLLISNVINRETGSHHVIRSSEHNRDPMSIRTVSQDGNCEASAFSGFPTIQTKF